MDPLASEDEFDKLLGEELVADDFLRAVNVLEDEALRSCSAPKSVAPNPVAGPDEYDLMLTDDLSIDVLVAFDEAERVAGLPYKVLDGKELANTTSSSLDAALGASNGNVIALPPEPESVPVVKSEPSMSPRIPAPQIDEFDLLLADELSHEVLLAYEEAESVDFVPVICPANSPSFRHDSSSTFLPLHSQRQATDEVSVAVPSSSISLPASLPASSSSPLSTPFRNVTNYPQTTRSPVTRPKKGVVLCSPISISSGSSSDASDDSDGCSTPWTSPVHVVENSSTWRTFLSPKIKPLPTSLNRKSTTRQSIKSTTSTISAASSTPAVPPSLKRKADWSHKPRPVKKLKKQTHLEAFFANYPRFHYDPTAPVSAQYDAMCRMYFSRPKYEHGTVKSERESKAAREAAYAGYQLAMARTFAEIFGEDVNDLGNWQSLCRVLEIDPVPQNLYACRAAVREIHVNLVDLVDWGGTGAPITKFDSLQELAEYTHLTRKFFPQDRAEEGGLLKYLLRHVL
ncbi:hypothetical protein DFH06DRAFT_511301 [Mycena polygramma]|nr:hypothetical protein DFH06DRAFT_511301 [Mycena polygramma]